MRYIPHSHFTTEAISLALHEEGLRSGDFHKITMKHKFLIGKIPKIFCLQPPEVITCAKGDCALFFQHTVHSGVTKRKTG
jgi:hypothetical protein